MGSLRFGGEAFELYEDDEEDGIESHEVDMELDAQKIKPELSDS